MNVRKSRFACRYNDNGDCDHTGNDDVDDNDEDDGGSVFTTIIMMSGCDYNAAADDDVTNNAARSSGIEASVCNHDRDTDEGLGL